MVGDHLPVGRRFVNLQVVDFDPHSGPYGKFVRRTPPTFSPKVQCRHTTFVIGRVEIHQYRMWVGGSTTVFDCLREEIVTQTPLGPDSVVVEPGPLAIEGVVIDFVERRLLHGELVERRQGGARFELPYGRVETAEPE